MHRETAPRLYLAFGMLILASAIAVAVFGHRAADARTAPWDEITSNGEVCFDVYAGSSPSGAGDATVDDKPDCDTQWTDGATVGLTATPYGYNRFDGWGGDCSGSEQTTSVS